MTSSAWRVGDRVRSRVTLDQPAGAVVEVQDGDGAFSGVQTVGYRRDDGELHVALGGELEAAD